MSLRRTRSCALALERRGDEDGGMRALDLENLRFTRREYALRAGFRDGIKTGI